MLIKLGNCKVLHTTNIFLDAVSDLTTMFLLKIELFAYIMLVSFFNTPLNVYLHRHTSHGSLHPARYEGCHYLPNGHAVASVPPVD